MNQIQYLSLSSELITYQHPLLKDHVQNESWTDIHHKDVSKENHILRCSENRSRHTAASRSNFITCYNNRVIRSNVTTYL